MTSLHQKILKSNLGESVSTIQSSKWEEKKGIVMRFWETAHLPLP